MLTATISEYRENSETTPCHLSAYLFLPDKGTGLTTISRFIESRAFNCSLFSIWVKEDKAARRDKDWVTIS